MASDTGNSSSDLGGKSQLVEDDSSNLGGNSSSDLGGKSQLVEYALSNLGGKSQLVEDGSTSSTNWDLPPRYDITPGESDGESDSDEMSYDYVADLPLEAHVVPDDVADLLLEAHVVPDDVANGPQEAHVVGDHAANSQRLCPICDNAIGVAFCCGHLFCVECGDRYSTCPICRDRVHIRIRVF